MEHVLSAAIDRCNENTLEMSLAYDEEALDGYNFSVGSPVKISSEIFGTGVVGVRAVRTCHGRSRVNRSAWPMAPDSV